MLIDRSEQQMIWIALDYPAEPSHTFRVLEAVEVIKKATGADKFAASQGTLLVRQPKERILWYANAGRIGFHALRMGMRGELVQRVSRMVTSALKSLKIDKLKRIGLKTITYAPLQMTHAELVTLMFGTYAAKADELQSVAGDFDDMNLQLYGSRRGLKYILQLNPQSAEQVDIQTRADPYLEFFLDDRWNDSFVRTLLADVARDCLQVDVDLYTNDVSIDGIDYFLAQAGAATDEMTEAAINRLIAIQK